jgi:hypothetical protein
VRFTIATLDSTRHAQMFFADRAIDIAQAERSSLRISVISANFRPALKRLIPSGGIRCHVPMFYHRNKAALNIWPRHR